MLAGTSKAISNKTPLVIEFWPYGMLRAKSYMQLKKALLSGGYTKFYQLDGEIRETEISDSTLDAL